MSEACKANENGLTLRLDLISEYRVIGYMAPGNNRRWVACIVSGPVKTPFMTAELEGDRAPFKPVRERFFATRSMAIGDLWNRAQLPEVK